jgi:hypothetical protein
MKSAGAQHVSPRRTPQGHRVRHVAAMECGRPEPRKPAPRPDRQAPPSGHVDRDVRVNRRSDTGSGGMSLMLLVASVALLMILGLIVDGGAKARALDHAGAIASEAARAAAATYRPGDAAINPADADRAAQDYLTAAGATGTITVAGLDVEATATLQQPTVFLPLVGIDAFTVTGSGQAQVVYQQGGTP